MENQVSTNNQDRNLNNDSEQVPQNSQTESESFPSDLANKISENILEPLKNAFCSMVPSNESSGDIYEPVPKIPNDNDGSETIKARLICRVDDITIVLKSYGKNNTDKSSIFNRSKPESMYTKDGNYLGFRYKKFGAALIWWNQFNYALLVYANSDDVEVKAHKIIKFDDTSITKINADVKISGDIITGKLKSERENPSDTELDEVIDAVEWSELSISGRGGEIVTLNKKSNEKLIRTTHYELEGGIIKNVVAKVENTFNGKKFELQCSTMGRYQNALGSSNGYASKVVTMSNNNLSYPSNELEWCKDSTCRIHDMGEYNNGAWAEYIVNYEIRYLRINWLLRDLKNENIKIFDVTN